MQPYPQLNKVEDLMSVVQKIVQLRKQQDIIDRNNFPSIFLSGRTTTRIPSSAADVIDGDRVGDVTNDDIYLYQLLDVTGGPLWSRIALDTSW